MQNVQSLQISCTSGEMITVIVYPQHPPSNIQDSHYLSLLAALWCATSLDSFCSVCQLSSLPIIQTVSSNILDLQVLR